MESRSISGAGLARQLGFGVSPLRRSVDRLEAAVLIGTLLLGLLAVPVAAAVGTGAHEAAARQAAHQRSLLHVVPARTLEDALAPVGPDGPVVGPLPVRVSWVDHTGVTKRAAVEVEPGTPAGTKVSVWVDAHGREAPPPSTASETVMTGVWTAVGGLLAAWSCLTLAVVGIRRALDRSRLRMWETEWRQVAPHWTGRDPGALS
jgi:hypothetical protein